MCAKIKIFKFKTTMRTGRYEQSVSFWRMQIFNCQTSVSLPTPPSVCEIPKTGCFSVGIQLFFHMTCPTRIVFWKQKWWYVWVHQPKGVTHKSQPWTARTVSEFAVHIFLHGHASCYEMWLVENFLSMCLVRGR